VSQTVSRQKRLLMNKIAPKSGEEAARITRYLDIDTGIVRSDVAIVFGTRLSEPAYLAAEVFHQGAVNYIVLTGGSNRRDGIGEARQHWSILVACGVPQEHVVLEQRSCNTLENVLFALEALTELRKVRQVKAVMAVTKWYHARRAVMTLKRHFPLGVRYFAVTYEPSFAQRDNWWLSEPGVRRVLKEWQSIPKYLAQGHIAEIYKDGGGYI